MALSQNESHLIPSLWFFLQSLFFISYFVMPSHTPVSCALIVDAISSPPAKQSHAPFPIWHSIPDCFDLFLCCCCAQVGSFWALEGSSAVLSAGPRTGTQAEGSPASTLHFPGWEHSGEVVSGAFSCPPENMCKQNFFPEAYHIAKSVWFLTRTEKGTYPVGTGSRFRSFFKSCSKLAVLGLLNETE